MPKRLQITAFSSVKSPSYVQLLATPCTAAHQASLFITNSWSLLTLMYIKSVMQSNYLIFCHPLLLLSSILPSIGVFSNESVLCISSAQFSHSVMSDSAILWTAARQASLSITNSWSLLKLMSIESVMPSNHLIFCHPLLLLPSIFPSIRVFSNKSALCIRWPKYWSFSFSISPSNEYSGLISFRMDLSPCSPRDSQESSPIPQFKSINSLVLSFLYSPSLTFIHDYWKKHSFD